MPAPSWQCGFALELALSTKWREQAVYVICRELKARAVPAFKNARCQEAFAPLQLKHLLLNAARNDEIVDKDRTLLTDAIRSISCLSLSRRIPPRIVVNHGIGAG